LVGIAVNFASIFEKHGGRVVISRVCRVMEGRPPVGVNVVHVCVALFDDGYKCFFLAFLL